MKGQILSRIQNFQTLNDHSGKIITEKQQAQRQYRQNSATLLDLNQKYIDRDQNAKIGKFVPPKKSMRHFSLLSQSNDCKDQCKQLVKNREKADNDEQQTRKSENHQNNYSVQKKQQANKYLTSLAMHHTMNTINRNRKIIPKLGPLKQSKSRQKLFQAGQRKNIHTSNLEHIKKTVNIDKIEEMGKADIKSADKLIMRGHQNENYLKSKKSNHKFISSNMKTIGHDQISIEQKDNAQNLGYRLNTITHTNNNQNLEMNVKSQNYLASPIVKKPINKSLWHIQSSKDLGQYHHQSSKRIVMRLFNTQSNKLNELSTSNGTSPMLTIHNNHEAIQNSNKKSVQSQKCIKVDRQSPTKNQTTVKGEEMERLEKVLLKPLNNRYKNNSNCQSKKQSSLMKTTTALFREKKYQPYFDKVRNKNTNGRDQYSYATKALFMKKNNELSDNNEQLKDEAAHLSEKDMLHTDNAYINTNLLRKEQRKMQIKNNRFLTNEKIMTGLDKCGKTNLCSPQNCGENSHRQESINYGSQESDKDEDVSIQLNNISIQEDDQVLRDGEKKDFSEDILNLCTVSRIQQANMQNDSSFLQETQKILIEELKNKQKIQSRQRDKVTKKNKKLWSKLPQDFMGN